MDYPGCPGKRPLNGCSSSSSSNGISSKMYPSPSSYRWTINPRLKHIHSPTRRQRDELTGMHWKKFSLTRSNSSTVIIFPSWEWKPLLNNNIMDGTLAIDGLLHLVQQEAWTSRDTSLLNQMQNASIKNQNANLIYVIRYTARQCQWPNIRSSLTYLST